MLKVVICVELDKKLIGIRIMQRRKAYGLTQEELAERIGYSKNHLSSVERGKFVPTTQFIFKTCSALGETPDYYLIGKISQESEKISELAKCLPIDAQRLCCRILQVVLDEIQNNDDSQSVEMQKKR